MLLTNLFQSCLNFHKKITQKISSQYLSVCHGTAWGRRITQKNVWSILCNYDIMNNRMYNHDFSSYIILPNQNHIKFYPIYYAMVAYT